MIFFALLISLSTSPKLVNSIVTRNWPAIYNSATTDKPDDRFFFVVSLLRMRKYDILYQYYSTRMHKLSKPEFFAFLYSLYNIPSADSMFYRLIEEGLTFYPDLGDFLLFLRISKNISKQKTKEVLIDLRILRKKYPRSYFLESSIMSILRYLYSNSAHKEYKKVYTGYSKFLKYYSDRAEALYYLAMISRASGDKKGLRRISDILITRYYKSPFSYRVIRFASKKYVFYKGLSAFYSGKYKTAIKYLRKTRLAKKYHYLTISYYRAGYFSRLIKLYKKGRVPDSLIYYVGLAYEKKKKYEDAVKFLLKTLRARSRYAGNAAYELSFIFVNNPRVFKKWEGKLPLVIHNADYLMRMGLVYMVSGKRQRAQAFFEKVLTLNDRFASSQALYWLYRMSGIGAYRDFLLREHPFSYFAWITNGNKVLAPVDSVVGRLLQNNGNFFLKSPKFWNRFHTFAFLGLNNYALRELRKCSANLRECVEFSYLTGEDNLTVEIFRRFIGLERKKKGLVFGYPLAYWYYIQGEASEPFLFVSLLREESHFNHMAVSPAGAIGIAQLMPFTAAKLLGRRVKRDELLDPYFNIRLGARYLNSLIEKYNGRLIFALAAYNAGPKRVDAWIKKYSQSGIAEDPYLFVEFIPFRETRNYVRRIMKDYRLYKRLYNSYQKELLDRQAS